MVRLKKAKKCSKRKFNAGRNGTTNITKYIFSRKNLLSLQHYFFTQAHCGEYSFGLKAQDFSQGFCSATHVASHNLSVKYISFLRSSLGEKS